MTSQTVGERLSDRLHAVEAAIDIALNEASALMALLPSARAEARLSVTEGQRVYDDAAASIVALTQARARMVGTHNALAGLARRAALEPLAIGPLDKPEDAPPNGAGIVARITKEVNKSLPGSPDAC